MKKIILLFLLAGLTCFTYASDTIKMMQYNLMYYSDDAPEGCTGTSNALADKDTYIKNILQYVKPDILCVNEIGKNSVYANRLLQNAINTNGVTYFATCTTQSNSSSGISIGNRLFYDTRKFIPEGTFYVPTTYSYFNGYRFYLNSPDLEKGDTVHIIFIVGHLKAGSYESARRTQVELLMSYIDSHNLSGNIILSGDFNSAGTTESCISYLLNPATYEHRFIDPAGQTGEWNSNSNFAQYHTQSTHYSNNDGCFSGSGLDDRFDLILVSPAVQYGNNGVKALSATYETYGQDGEHFNKGLLSPTNHSGVPTHVLQALYNNSDHLPVILQFAVNADKVGVCENAAQKFVVEVENPIRNAQLSFYLTAPQEEHYTYSLYTMDGKLLMSEEIASGSEQTHVTRDFPFASGLYFLKVADSHGDFVTKKMIK